MSPRGPWYFGCTGYGRSAGHDLLDESGMGLCYYTARRYLRLELDGGYPPPEPSEARWQSLPEEQRQPQGLARLTVEGETTILAFWERTGDDRLGSHSTFVLPGVLDFAAAVAAARAAFPRIWERLDRAGVVVRPERAP